MHDLSATPLPTIDDVLEAHRRIGPLVRRTPVRTDPGLDRALGCRVHLKCEQLQEIGAFKIRGAMNAVLRLRERGRFADVATHSSGNHGAAVAAAARHDGRGAVVVMPENSVEAKVRNVRRFGGEVVFCAANQAAREQGLERLVGEGLIPVHPYDQFEIIAGQGTVALEFLEQAPAMDTFIAPIGGGGLVSGCAIVCRDRRPDMQLLGVEPEGAAETAASLERGRRVLDWRPETIADGLRATVGALPFRVISQHLDGVLTVSEAGILAGMELLRDHLDMLVEPSSATVIAAILEHPGVFAGRAVGAVLTGGNVDESAFPPFAPRANG